MSDLEPATDAATSAWAAWRAGCSTIPVRDDGSKKPLVAWEQYQHRLPTEAEMTEWFTGPNAANAAAIICGPVSGGLVMIEMEGPDYEDGRWQTFRNAAVAALGEARWRQVTACVEMSPTGGPHLLIRCTEATVGNLKLARRQTGPKEVQVIMETRGQGGYVVIAGSVGHATGNSWSMAQGTYDEIATVTADELHAILNAARRLDEMPTRYVPVSQATTQRFPTTQPGDSVFDAVVAEYNRRTSWDDVLRGVFEYAYQRGQVTYWHRIGSDNETGATTNATGNDTLIVFTTSTVFDSYDGTGPAPSYDRFSAYAVLEHRGDRTEAYRTLRDAGYGPPAKAAEPDPFGRDREPLGAAPRTADPETGEIPASDAPVPLDRFDLPKFPLDVLPKWMRAEVVATAEAIQAPVEIAAGLALVALSTACAGKVDVDGINYRQPSNVYLAIVAASGIGKSPVAARMLQPLYELEEQLAEEAKDSIARAMADEAAIEEQISAAKAQLKKDPSSSHARDAMRDAELARLGHEVPATPRLIADDHTPEALGQLIAGQKGTRMAVLSPEGATLFSSMTGQRYKSGDAPPEVPPVYLKSWGGEPMPIDRKGSASITVKRPILTVGVLVQPFVVDRLAMTPQIAAQGALARFLWIVAEDNVGRRDRSRRRHVAPLSTEYVDRVTAMARLCASWEFPTVLRATDEAADHLDAVNEQRERRMGLGGDLDAYREIEAKIVGYQWRLAGLLAMAHEDDRSGGISLERAKQAETLADYFMAHSIAVHRRAGLDERGGTLRACAAYMTKHADETIDWRDFRLAMRSVYGSISEAQPDLAELERMRWITIKDGEIASVGIQGSKNPTVRVRAAVRAFSAGKDGQ